MRITDFLMFLLAITKSDLGARGRLHHLIHIDGLVQLRLTRRHRNHGMVKCSPKSVRDPTLLTTDVVYPALQL